MSAPPSPPHPDQAAFEAHEGRVDSGLLILADHATNQIPAALGDLGLPASERERHIAYDVGVRGVAVHLARLLGAPMLGSTFSRLVIDPNRGEDDPTLIMRLYDRTIIPGNAHIDAAERERRLERYHRPYHRAIEAQMAAMTAATGEKPLLFSIHSFTPALIGRPPRPWHAGVLWAEDRETAMRLLDMLRQHPDLCVGDNEPYNGALPGDVMDRHGAGAGARHVLLEIRNDLIADDAGQAAWAERLAPMAQRLLDHGSD